MIISLDIFSPSYFLSPLFFLSPLRGGGEKFLPAGRQVVGDSFEGKE